ncbi:MAG: thiamine diphosphokinase [candidate division Zixibacteria bacterium]|nr:thiamine diphosphokinase [candidate division Zixibacteria bacterium]
MADYIANPRARLSPSDKTFALFLNGEYSSEEDSSHRDIIENCVTIAVDGGARIFERLRLAPDILLGDFDSAPDSPERFKDKSEIIRHDKTKNESDGELAVKLAIERGAERLLILGYGGQSETDHLIGNLMLLPLAERIASEAGAMIECFAAGAHERIWYILDQKIKITTRAGDFVSIIPLDQYITLGVEGAQYPADDLRVERGSSRSLRNRATGDRVDLEISGAALVFWSENLIL